MKWFSFRAALRTLSQNSLRNSAEGILSQKTAKLLFTDYFLFWLTALCFYKILFVDLFSPKRLFWF